MMTGNKGEWSEVYVLLKLLADAVLYPGNERLDRIEGIKYPIIQIERAGEQGTICYSIEADLVKHHNTAISRGIFQNEASYLLKQIQAIKTSAGIPQTEQFLRSIGCHQLKAKSTLKADIRIIIHDCRTGLCPSLGFSIKSHLGNTPTLLNASQATNFTFTLDGGQYADFSDINSINDKVGKIQKRIEAIERRGGNLFFSSIDNTVFRNNLQLIDSALPQILAELLSLYYRGKGSRLLSLCNELEVLNPLNFDQSTEHKYYAYKIKKFLVEVALGLLPNKVWTGKYDATGGYIVVKEDGDIVCYHFYDRNYFEDYLFYNVKLDTPSSTRHNFGVIAEDLTFRLNLQLRFI